MRRILKIIITVFVTIIILVGAFAAVLFLDLAAYTATGSNTLTQSGTSSGKALVVYDPGLSGTAKGVADKIASDLQTSGYTVTLAGIKSSAAAHTSDYRIIVAGGPVYAGSITLSVKDFLDNLKPSEGVKVGVFGSGQGSTTPSDVTMIKNSVPALSSTGSLSNSVVVKIGQSENLDTRAQELVSQLT